MGGNQTWCYIAGNFLSDSPLTFDLWSLGWRHIKSWPTMSHRGCGALEILSKRSWTTTKAGWPGRMTGQKVKRSTVKTKGAKAYGRKVPFFGGGGRKRFFWLQEGLYIMISPKMSSQKCFGEIFLKLRFVGRRSVTFGITSKQTSIYIITA